MIGFVTRIGYGCRYLVGLDVKALETFSSTLMSWAWLVSVGIIRRGRRQVKRD